MPELRIRFILTAVVVSSFFVGENLIAGEPDQPFRVQPKASFSPSNFTAPSDSAPTPPAPRSSAQLYSFRDALSSSPPQESQIQPKVQQQIQTANMTGREITQIQQVAVIEPKPLPLPTMSVKTEEIDENDRIATVVPKENLKKDGDSSNSDNWLDKPIGSGKVHNGKGLLEHPKFTSSIAPLISVFGSLLIVISAFLILILFLKKVSPKGNRLLPHEAFEDLGRAVLMQKLQLHLLRLGNRLILVSISPDGVSPITEVTDPDEVVSLLGMCRQLDPNSSTEFFRKAVNSFPSSKAEGGYFGVNVKKSTPKTKSKSKIDLYSEPDESLAEILAKGGQHG